MKQIIRQFTVLFLVMAVVITTGGCSDDNKSSLQLDKDVWLTVFELDSYPGVIDNTTCTVVVGVPESYNTDEMKVTAIETSESAVASMRAGDVANFSFPQTVRVTSGNTFLDYTVTVKHDEARITSFELNGSYKGIINEGNHTILVYVPTTVKVTDLIPAIEVSEGAEVSPLSGQAVDFTNPVEFTVTCQSAKTVYTVTVIQSDSPSAVYVGLAATIDELNPEEKEAANWMLQNVPNARYVSFEEVRTNAVDLDECKVMWWHFHVDETIDDVDNFRNRAADAISASTSMKEFYQNGGSLLLTRYATFYPAVLGVTDESVFPNNCWLGRAESNPEITTGAWSFVKQTGHENHPIYANLVSGAEANRVYTCDTGYGITNTTAQWITKEKEDWSTYIDYNDWRTKTGAIDLAYGDPNTVVIWEFEPKDNKGRILCIGSGCYDWYTTTDASNDQYHGNVATMTLNAINYLKGE